MLQVRVCTFVSRITADAEVRCFVARSVNLEVVDKIHTDFTKFNSVHFKFLCNTEHCSNICRLVLLKNHFIV
jgi:hypothetical protein